MRSDDVAMPNASLARHVCHCGKSFLRKEHLTRHQSTHIGRTFVCSVCRSAFTRNDLLRRHMIHHNPKFATHNSVRSRACDLCHANKTKCDNGIQCSLCSKRAKRCTYKLVAVAKSTLKDKHVASSTKARNRPAVQETDDSLSASLITTTLEVPGQHVAGLAVSGLAQFINLLIPTARKALADEYEVSDEDKPWIDIALDKYLGAFHHTWPVIHSPTFYITPPALGLTATVIMIGSWLGKPELKGEATELHLKLMDKLFVELTRPAARDITETPWSTELYQTATLNIIFAFYHGGEELVARAMLLKGLLVSTLREIDYFASSKADHHQKIHFPGTYAPFLLATGGRHKRVIAALYKVDAYMAISRWQPPTIYREELDVSLPSTSALWNCSELHLFFKRQSREPDRTMLKISQLTGIPSLLFKPWLLLEDVQLAFCGLARDIWGQIQAIRQPGNVTMSSTQKLSCNVETWKIELDRIYHQCMNTNGTEMKMNMPFAAYVGRFDENPAKEKIEAISHIAMHASEAQMLYHILAMQLNSDLKAMHTVSLYLNKGKQSVDSISIMVGVLQTHLQEWANAPSGRRTVVHAIVVLRLREIACSSSDFVKCDIDPVAELASFVSSLVVWAWLAHTLPECSCQPSSNHIDIAVDS